MPLNKMGIDQNTMVWFCSDNGPEVGTPGETAGFRERKRSLYEGGVRVPGILVWPAKFSTPFKTDFPAVTSDYLPTIASALEIDETELPYQLDGLNLMPMLEGRKTQREKPIGISYKNQISFSGNRFKVYVKDGIPEYYDIVSDPYEMSPLPENVEFIQLNNEMTRFLNSCKASFQGEEYGRESYDRMQQNWLSPYNYAEDRMKNDF